MLLFIAGNPLSLGAVIANLIIPALFILGWVRNRPKVMPGLMMAKFRRKGVRYVFYPNALENQGSRRGFAVNVPEMTALALASENGLKADRPAAASFFFIRSSLCAVYNGHRLIYNRQEAIKLIRWLNVGGWRWLSICGLTFLSLYCAVTYFYLAKSSDPVLGLSLTRLALPWVLATLVLAALGWKALADLRVGTMIKRLEAALPDLAPESEPGSAPGRPPLPRLWPAVITLVLVALFGLAQVCYMLSF